MLTVFSSTLSIQWPVVTASGKGKRTEPKGNRRIGDREEEVGEDVGKRVLQTW